VLDLFDHSPAALPPEERILRAIQAGGARVERVHLTRNRRVMASLAEGGEALRIHELFRDAPEEVLRSLGRIFSSRPAPERRAARAEVRAFLSAAAPPVPPVPRRARHRAGDRPILQRLAEEFTAVNATHFGGRLPRVTIRLSDRMRRRIGHFDAATLEIALSRRLCENAAPGEAEQTLRHEMIHLWQYVEGRKVGHGGDFRRWARRLGIHPRASRAVDWTCTGP